MERCWSTIHWFAICLTLFGLLLTKNVQADFLHYFKLKKLLTVAVVAKALTQRKPRIIPVPIPIPIPIHQNEIITLPSSVAKKMIILGSGYQKQPGNEAIILKGDNVGNLGSPPYGSSAYGYTHSNKGRFSRENGGKGFFGLSSLASLASLSNPNSVKFINMDSLMGSHHSGDQFSIGSSNTLDSKLLLDTHSQFPIRGLAGRLPMVDTPLYSNNQLNGYGNSFLGGYNPYMDQNIYPQTIRNPRKRPRKYRRKKSFYRKPVTQHSHHMNPTDNRNYPSQTKSPSPLQNVQTKFTIDVGDKMSQTLYESRL